MRRRVLMGLKAEYGEWTISIDVVPSSVANTGGTVRIAARASRQVWWHDGTETVETVEDIPVSVSGLASGDSYVDGILTVAANSLSSIKTITVSASYEDVSVSVSIQQAAKSIASYGEWEVDLSTSVSSVTAAQSTVRLSYSASREVKWTDGSTTRETGVPAIEVSTGSVSDSLWTIPSNTETSDKTHTVTASYGEVNTSKSVLQTKDEISSYGEVNLVAGTINDIPASGGGSMSYGSSATQQITWVSGRKTTAYPSVTEGSMDYDSSKGTTISGRTLIGNVTVSASGQGGKTATKTIAVYQAANLITKVEAGSNSFSYSPIAAGATSAAATSSHSPKYKFSSGASGTTTPDSKYGTLQTSVIYSIANTTTNGFTAVNSSTGALTATSRGTTYGASSRASATVTKTLKYTWTHSSDYGGSSVNTGDLTKTATCSQDANLITKLELQNASGGALTAPGTYSAAEQTQSVANKTAASCGCKVTFSSTSSSTSYSTWVTLTTNYSWSSNQSYATLTSANASSLNVKMAGRGTTTGDARNATITRQAQFTATLKSGYTSASAVSTTASCTATVIQQANTADASSKITAYGTPSVSIGTGITAGGGSATITRSVSNTRTYYYTSGSAGRTASEAGTVNLAIQSNGNNRFSLSGTTLSHSSMTTNAVTDSCTVRATNAGDSSKYKDATTSVTNAKDASFTYGDVTIGTYSYETFDGGATTKDPTLSYSQTRTGKYTSGSTSSTTTITSGATLAYSMTTTSIFTGIVASSGRITSVLRSEAGPAHTTTATVKVTLNGKSATKSTTVTSAENLFVITKVNTVTNSERYTQFPVALNYFMGKTAGDTCQLSGFLYVNISKSMSNGSSGSNGVECVPITDLESYGLTLSILSGSLKNYANVTNAGLVTLSRNISSSTSSGTTVFGISYNGSVLCQLSVKMTFLSSPTKGTQTINWTINGDYSDLVAGNYYGNITRYRLCFLLYMTSSSDDWESTVYGMPYVMHIKTNDAGLKSGTLTVPFTMQGTNTYVYAKMALVNPSGAGSLLTTSSSSVGGGRVMLSQSFTGSQTVSFSYTAG